MSNLQAPEEIGGRGAVKLPEDRIYAIRVPAGTFASASWLRFQPTGTLQAFDPTADFELTVQASEVSAHPIKNPRIPFDPSASAISDTEIDIDAVIDSIGHDGLKIERSTTSGSGFTEIVDIDENELPFRDTGLDPGTSYFYQLRTYIWDGDQLFSDYTAEVTATTGSGGEAPGATGQPQAVESSRAADGSTITMDVSVTAPTEGDPPTEYQWYAGDEGSDLWSQGTATAPNSTGSTETDPVAQITFPRAQLDDDWFVCVRAVNSSGPGPYSCNGSTSGTLPKNPGNLKPPVLDNVDLADGVDDIRASFTPDADDDAADDYQMLRDGAVVVTGAAGCSSGCTLTEANVAEGTYDITVRARNATASPDEFSFESNSKSITVGSENGGGSEDHPNEPGDYSFITERPFDAKAEDDWTFRDLDNYSIIQDDTAPRSCCNIGEAEFDAGDVNGTAPIDTRRSYSAKTELYAHYWLKVSENWQGHKNKINKIIFLFGPDTEKMYWNMWSSEPFTSLKLQIKAHGTWGDNLGTRSTIVRGQWHEIESVMVHNTPGVADGEVHVWMDGTKVLEHFDVIYSLDGEQGVFDDIRWNPTYGGGEDTIIEQMWMWMDHIYLSGK